MIDEDLLNTKINKLEGRISVKNQELTKMTKVIFSLKNICKKGDVMPDDDKTDQIMSDVRRQEIYDKCMPVADEILGTTSTAD